ncbi:MAG: PEP-CTERM sorting domain-containing protein [Verrucomicrobiae bacterium]|nr:PEP-CTERM sorting domain-containing protein [Verrucomicrobiae bacterium]NNJ41980.1 PEP-CTERM sorting domain-containing protein [Akkermansiaceae bacterium]
MTLHPTIIFLSLLFSQASFGALSLENHQANQHDRFNNNPAFIGAAHDWSGVARSSNGRWVTMISSTYFITANHAAPAVGNSVIFHEDNNAAGTTVTRTVSERTRVGGTDLVIGRLNSAPGATIAIYGLASNTTNQANFASSAYSDRTAFIVGKASSGSLTTEFRVGRNVLDGFYNDAEVPGTQTVSGSLTGIGDALTFDDDRNTAESLGDDEAFLQSGDSGAPLFVTSDDDLILTGINWFITSGENPNFSGTTFTPNYISEIESIVSAGGESLTLVSVPEPSGLILLGLSSIISLLYRRR